MTRKIGVLRMKSAMERYGGARRAVRHSGIRARWKVRKRRSHTEALTPHAQENSVALGAFGKRGSDGYGKIGNLPQEAHSKARRRIGGKR